MNKKTKFTLCFESTKHDGFITEKITDAFFADTIPVYYGSATVVDIFNPNAFVNVSDFATIGEAIERIKQIDQDDELYLKMLRCPIYKEENYVSKLHQQLEQYICHIFDQPIEQAYRRSKVYWPKKMEQYLLMVQQPEKYLDQVSFFQLIRGMIRKVGRKIVLSRQ